MAFDPNRPICEKPPILDIKFIPYSLQDWLRRLLGLINYNADSLDNITTSSEVQISARVFGSKVIPPPDIRAGANITLVHDAQGVTISAAGGSALDADGILQVEGFSPHSPAPFDIQAGTNITIVRNAQGYVISGTAAAPDFSLDQHVLANMVFGG